MNHPGVTCPTCECWKSPKKLYHTEETAEHSLGKKHAVRCNECGAEFTFIPIKTETRSRCFGVPGLVRTRTKITITAMVVVNEGEL